MTYQPAATSDDLNAFAKLPGWITSRSREASQNVVFLSGATFAMLDMVLQKSGEAVPEILLANTLALDAAVATSKLEGRLARKADIRDAYHLTPPDANGDRHWGPDGDVLAFWRTAVRIRLRGSDWMRNVADHVDAGFADAVEDWLLVAMDQARTHGPLMAATRLLRTVLDADDRAERIACLLSDVVLGKFFLWERALPLTALHLTKAMLRDLRNGESEATRAADLPIQNALLKSAQTTYSLAATLSSRSTALRSVAPRLRAKGSDDAIALFLSEAAVSPAGMLSPTIKGSRTPMTDRAARRLCDRLVELGVAQELTGRPTFRLYGIGP